MLEAAPEELGTAAQATETQELGAWDRAPCPGAPRLSPPVLSVNIV